MFNKGLLLMMALGASSAYAAKSPPIIHDSQIPFSPDDAAWAKSGGNNTILGSALLRTAGGDVKTCAGLTVQLVPRTPYGEDRLVKIYGSAERGLFLARSPFQVTPARPEYQQLVRSSVCDPEGRFKFDGLADGIYFLNTQVVWVVPNRYFTQREGGSLMMKVEVTGGEKKEIVMTQ